MTTGSCSEREPAVVVLRCRDCGDVFPVEETDEAECPSCGGRRLAVAGEPLL